MPSTTDMDSRRVSRVSTRFSSAYESGDVDEHEGVAEGSELGKELHEERGGGDAGEDGKEGEDGEEHDNGKEKNTEEKALRDLKVHIDNMCPL